MNAFEFGFFSELEKISAVEDGTLATKGRLVKYENDRSSAFRARRSGNYPYASASRRLAKLDDIDERAKDHGAIGALLGVAPGAVAGGTLGAIAGGLSSQGSDSGVKAGFFTGIPVGAFAGTTAGMAAGRSVSKPLQNLVGAARVLRANTYVRSRAAREAQGLGNKVRAFINPGQA